MTLEQTRAALAYGHVQEIQAIAEAEQTRYGAMAHKLPALLRSAGLCQALHFVSSRQKPTYDRLLGHLAAQLRRVDPEIGDASSLCDRVRSAELPTYLWLSREALACTSWYSRLAQSVLRVERDAELGDGT